MSGGWAMYETSFHYEILCRLLFRSHEIESRTFGTLDHHMIEHHALDSQNSHLRSPRLVAQSALSTAWTADIVIGDIYPFFKLANSNHLTYLPIPRMLVVFHKAFYKAVCAHYTRTLVLCAIGFTKINRDGRFRTHPNARFHYFAYCNAVFSRFAYSFRTLSGDRICIAAPYVKSQA